MLIRNIEVHRAKRARDASKRCLLSDGKINLKSATAAAGLPTDRLHNHGTSAGLKTLFPNIFGGTAHYFRGSWEYLRGVLNSYGEV